MGMNSLDSNAKILGVNGFGRIGRRVDWAATEQRRRAGQRDRATNQHAEEEGRRRGLHASSFGEGTAPAAAF